MESPHVPLWFREELDAYSVAATGLRDQYRPVWNGANWIIEHKGEAGWVEAVVVIDRDKVTAEHMYPYAPLSRDVFDILMEADLFRRFDAGSLKSAHAQRRTSGRMRSVAREIEQGRKSTELLAEIWRDNVNILKRAVYENQYGHSHGYRTYFNGV